MKFPYKAFLLTSSLKVKEVEVVAFAFYGSKWLKIAGSNTTYHVSKLFSSRELAIAEANRQVAVFEQRLDKSMQNLTKKKAALALLQK
jgi:hypothetical protein